MSDSATVSADVDSKSADTDPFTQLQRRVQAAGLLEPRPGYYVWRIACTLLVTAAGWALVVRTGDSWWQVAAAAFLGLCYTQLALLGHDIGHRQVARSRTGQNLLGWSLGNLLLGFSSGWWVRHHNNHHRFPNHLERDKGVTRHRFIATPEQGPTRQGRRKQFIVRHQHALFIPLLCTEGIGLRLVSCKAIKARKVPRPVVEGVLLALEPCGLPRRRLHDPPATQGDRLSDRSPSGVWLLPGMGLRSQPQRHAPPARRSGLGLAHPADHDHPEPALIETHPLDLRRRELPHRTPSLSHHGP